MIEEFTPAWAGAFEQLGQPVLFVRDETVIYRNAAAEKLLCGMPLSLSDCLPFESLDCYRAFTGAGTLLMTVSFGGQLYSATVTRGENADIFVLNSAPLDDGGRSALPAAVARTINQTLNEMLSAVESFLPDHIDDPEISQAGGRVTKGIYQLSRLSGNLVDLSTARRGVFHKVEFVETLRRFVRRLTPLCAEAGVELRFTTKERVMSAVIDEELLDRAMLSLISNSLRFSGKTIELCLYRVEGRAVIKFSDDGEGMEPLDLADALSPLRREVSPLDDPRRGAGLGLAVACRIAMIHGGTLILRSEPGKGTTALFSVSLRLTPTKGENVFSPRRSLNSDLVGLSDALPAECFEGI